MALLERPCWASQVSFFRIQSQGSAVCEGSAERSRCGFGVGAAVHLSRKSGAAHPEDSVGHRANSSSYSSPFLLTVPILDIEKANTQRLSAPSHRDRGATCSLLGPVAGHGDPHHAPTFLVGDTSGCLTPALAADLLQRPLASLWVC